MEALGVIIGSIGNMMFNPIDRLIAQVCLAIVLFWLINYIGEKSWSKGYMSLSMSVRPNDAPLFNFILKILAPIVYLIIVATILYLFKMDKYVDYIYLVSFYYIFLRMIVNIMILGRGRLMNWGKEIIYIALILFFSIKIYGAIIITKLNIFPDTLTIANQIWFGILLFLYEIFNNQKSEVGPSTINRKNNYIKKKYDDFYKKYHKIIKYENNKKLEALIYSIIIFENFNRPVFIRMFERILFYFGKAKTLGVMQMKTDQMISDEESVKKGVEKIFKIYRKCLKDFIKGEFYESNTFESHFDYIVLDEITKNYNADDSYIKDVKEVYDFILKNIYNGSHVLVKEKIIKKRKKILNKKEAFIQLEKTFTEAFDQLQKTFAQAVETLGLNE